LNAQLPNRTSVSQSNVERKAEEFGSVYVDPVKVAAAGGWVIRNGEWFISTPCRLNRYQLLNMLAALDGMAPGDMDA
jgi:hypothetical protein